MPTAKSTEQPPKASKQSPKTAKRNPTARKAAVSVETPKPRQRSVKAAGAPEPKSAHHRAAKRVTATPAEAEIVIAVITQQEIAELAYSYFVARGYQAGNQHEDWLRAERELRSRL